MHRTVPILACVILPLAGQALAEPVAELPLDRGYYVTADTACGDASNATLTLVTRTGINVAQAVCTIKSIDKTGPTTFNVTDDCIEIASGNAFGETTTAYDIPNSTTYRYVVDGGYTGEAKFCAQSDLPDPWTHNDISDLIK